MAKRKYKIINKRNKILNCIKILCLIIMIIIGGIIFNLGLNLETKILPSYTYKTQKSSDYKVILKPNNYYESGVIPSGLYYVSNSIDEIKLNFGYNFNSIQKSNIEYNYNIIANLVGTVKNENNESKEVWNRNFILKENDTSNLKDIEGFSLNDNINIDYKYYNNLVNSYEQTYSISIDAVLKVALKILFNINNLNKTPINVEDYIEVDIPITNTVTEVKQNYETETSKDIILEDKNINLNKIFCYIIGSIFIIGSLVIFVITQIINKKNITSEERYLKKVNKILKYYSNLIVTVTNKPNINDLKIMNVEVFEDLINMAEQTRQ